MEKTLNTQEDARKDYANTTQELKIVTPQKQSFLLQGKRICNWFLGE